MQDSSSMGIFGIWIQNLIKRLGLIWNLQTLRTTIFNEMYRVALILGYEIKSIWWKFRKNKLSD